MKINCFKGPSLMNPSSKVFLADKCADTKWKGNLESMQVSGYNYSQCYNNWQQSVSCNQHKHFTKAKKKKKKNTQLKMTTLHFTTTSPAKQNHMVEDEGYKRGMWARTRNGSLQVWIYRWALNLSKKEATSPSDSKINYVLTNDAPVHAGNSKYCKYCSLGGPQDIASRATAALWIFDVASRSKPAINGS